MPPRVSTDKHLCLRQTAWRRGGRTGVSRDTINLVVLPRIARLSPLHLLTACPQFTLSRKPLARPTTIPRHLMFTADMTTRADGRGTATAQNGATVATSLATNKLLIGNLANNVVEQDLRNALAGFRMYVSCSSCLLESPALTC